MNDQYEVLERLIPHIDAIPVIESLYNQDWRAYHNFTHVMRVIRHLMKFLKVRETVNPQALMLAAIFHDAIYVPGQKGSEEASALLLASFNLGAESQEAMRLIRLTEAHTPAEDDIDGIMLCDADLLDLSDPEIHEVNSFNIKIETTVFLANQGVEDVDRLWHEGRKKWLEGFLERPKIYHGPEMDALEKTARKNLRAELAGLS